jgi:methionyl aminopeptidase
MEKDVLESYNKAREISDQVIVFAKPLVKEDVKILELAESIEKKIVELKGGIAFPVNISINENAAHYTPDINDPLVLKEGMLMKIDFGVHVNGYIWDRAFSVFIGKETHPLIEASEKAMREAINAIKPGVKVYEISEVIQNTINGLGFNPIHNLCSHGLDQYTQHAPPTIPNGKNTIQQEIKEGQAIAVEVFATNGVGVVKESMPVLIYRFLQDKPTRMIEGRKILEKAKTDFEFLPFAKRWLTGITTGIKLDMALRQLTDVDALEGYPVLREESGGIVAQSEETVIVK